ncbi:MULTISPECIES: hypothetical protein [unclassified Enterobacter]|uniref:hypothetical protein n=1 Tax=unclassified Enterobacter TaxID=2608935 RepID=UPI000EFA09B9|nr:MULTISPECIES: hypothetical protein [unclassified Enterobacter]
MATVYRITITKKSKETFTGLMTRSQPEIVNGYVALAMDDGKWRYFSQDSMRTFSLSLWSSLQEKQRSNSWLTMTSTGHIRQLTSSHPRTGSHTPG